MKSLALLTLQEIWYTTLSKFKKPVSIETGLVYIDYLHFYKTNAPVGHVFVHFPQSMHFELSTLGALFPTCDNASTGQTAIAGH